MKFRVHLRLFVDELFRETRIFLIELSALNTRPITADRKSQIQICSTTSHNDYFMLLLAYKSLVHFTHLISDYLIYDDGTLTDDDKTKIRFHIKNVTIINKSQYNQKVRQYFGIKSPAWIYRNSPYVIKKFGTYLFATKPKIIFLDSDILFFRLPQEIIAWSNGSYDWFYLQDCLANSYVLSDYEAKDVFRLKLTPYVNSGLIGLPKKDLDINILLKLIDIHTSLSFGRPPQMQAYFSLLISKLKNKRNILPLPRNYLVTEDIQQFDKDLVCGHYTRLVRDRYFIDVRKVLSFLK